MEEAISAGNMPIALRLLGQSKQALNIDSRILLVADALRRHRNVEAITYLAAGGGSASLSFWEPLVRAWDAVDRRDAATALAALSSVPGTSAFAPFVDEETAFVLIKLRRTADAESYARRAIGSAGTREYRVRLALAGGFAAAGDRPRALAMLDGISGDTSAVRSALDAGRLKGLAIDDASSAFSDQLVALALEMRRSDRSPDDVLDIVQVARFADPDSSSALVLLGNVLGEEGRLEESLAAFRAVAAQDPLKGEAMDAEARALTGAKRFDEAFALAQGAASAPGATGDDFARLGDVENAMNRFGEAAAAYSEALRHIPNPTNAQQWPLLLLQASALQSAGRWPESKAALASAIAMAPNEPLVLNFLGYAKLQHGEDLDAAEGMIRKASALAPDDASITDSLGWALFKRGRIDEAIETLQKAAIGDPAQAEIQEHLGDALYSAGRKFEARFAWSAALATADQDETTRIRNKLEMGLTRETAAP